MKFPIFTVWNKRPPNREELSLAYSVHEKIYQDQVLQGHNYDQALRRHSASLPLREWTIVRYLGFDARGPAPGEQTLAVQRGMTKRGLSKLKHAMEKSK